MIALYRQYQFFEFKAHFYKGYAYVYIVTVEISHDYLKFKFQTSLPILKKWLLESV